MVNRYTGITSASPEISIKVPSSSVLGPPLSSKEAQHRCAAATPSSRPISSPNHEPSSYHPLPLNRHKKLLWEGNQARQIFTSPGPRTSTSCTLWIFSSTAASTSSTLQVIYQATSTSSLAPHPTHTSISQAMHVMTEG